MYVYIREKWYIYIYFCWIKKCGFVQKWYLYREFDIFNGPTKSTIPVHEHKKNKLDEVHMQPSGIMWHVYFSTPLPFLNMDRTDNKWIVSSAQDMFPQLQVGNHTFKDKSVDILIPDNFHLQNVHPYLTMYKHDLVTEHMSYDDFHILFLMTMKLACCSIWRI